MLAQKISSRAQVLTCPTDRVHPLLQYALQRPVKIGKHAGLGSGLTLKTMKVPADVNWSDIHTWTLPDPFLDGLADSERYTKIGQPQGSTHQSVPDDAWKPDVTMPAATTDQAVMSITCYSLHHSGLSIQDFSRVLYSLLSDNPRRTMSDFRRAIGLFAHQVLAHTPQIVSALPIQLITDVIAETDLHVFGLLLTCNNGSRTIMPLPAMLDGCVPDPVPSLYPETHPLPFATSIVHALRMLQWPIVSFSDVYFYTEDADAKVWNPRVSEYLWYITSSAAEAEID